MLERNQSRQKNIYKIKAEQQWRQIGSSPSCDAWAVWGESSVRPHKGHKNGKMDAVLTFSTVLSYDQRGNTRLRVQYVYMSVRACVLKCKHVNMFVFSSTLV